MAKTSAGLLPYRWRQGVLEVFIVHPGGPFWAKKDTGAWSISKGEYSDDEDPLDAARREFQEETSIVPNGSLLPLKEIKQGSGKRVRAWAFESDFDASSIRSNTFSMEWPPKSGKMQEYPEVDRGEWFPVEVARAKLLPAQVAFLDELVSCLSGESDR